MLTIAQVLRINGLYARAKGLHMAIEVVAEGEERDRARRDAQAAEKDLLQYVESLVVLP